MARLHSASAWTALVAMQLGTGCSSEGGATASGSADPTGSGGSGSSQGAGAGSVVSSSSASGIGASSGPTGSGGGATVVCDPPAPPGSIYEKAAEAYDIEQVDPVAMCAYRGDVMLIVNIAAL